MNVMRTPVIHLVIGKILLVSAVALVLLAIMQKPTIVVLLLTPTGVGATVVRLFLGLLAAVGIRSFLSGMLRGSRRRTRVSWKTIVAFGAMIALLVLVYAMLGSGAFTGLRPGGLVANRAYVTQLVAFTLLWLVVHDSCTCG
jgi:hypothetical protein